jgi:DNA ligase-associated metallophosphoesterase
VAAELELEIAGERLVALPDRALFWPSEHIVFVADVHLGKAATFRASAIPIPGGTTETILNSLSAVLNRTQARNLVFLGDLWHAKAGRTAGVVNQFLAWRRRHQDVEMTLVEGNHDRRSGRLPDEAEVLEVEEPHRLGPFALRHYPEPSELGYVLSGHLHPGAVLDGGGAQSMKLPCFWFGESVGVLPAFGDFTGCAAIQPSRQDRVIVLAENQVLSVGASLQ